MFRNRIERKLSDVEYVDTVGLLVMGILMSMIFLVDVLAGL